MTVPVLTAITDRWEAALVSGLEEARTDVVVVRRCVDLSDLLATAATGQAQAVVVSADLRRLDGEALDHLETAGVAVVGLVSPGDEAAERRLRQLGVGEVFAADAPATDVAAGVERAVRNHEARRRSPGSSRATRLADPAEALDDPNAVESLDHPSDVDGHTADHLDHHLDDHLAVHHHDHLPGRVVAVWGPTGAPGRTTVAVTLAAELAALGQDCVLADADTYGGCVAQVLGLLDEAPGLAAAARAADLGTLDLAQLSRFAPAVAPHLRVLTGIVRPQRWPELRPSALGTVLTLSRRLCRWTVVDCGFALEQDEEISYDTAAPRRNGATLTALEQADTVVVVGSGDPVGLQRLVRGLAELAELHAGIEPIVVVNRVRSSAVGGTANGRVRDALSRYAGVTELVLVPEERATLDAAVLAGRTVTESAPGSAPRRALAELAVRLVADAQPALAVTVAKRPRRRRRRGEISATRRSARRLGDG